MVKDFTCDCPVEDAVFVPTALRVCLAVEELLFLCPDVLPSPTV